MIDSHIHTAMAEETMQGLLIGSNYVYSILLKVTSTSTLAEPGIKLGTFHFPSWWIGGGKWVELDGCWWKRVEEGGVWGKVGGGGWKWFEVNRRGCFYDFYGML